MATRILNEQLCSSVKNYAFHCTVMRALEAVPAFLDGGPGVLVLVAPDGTDLHDYSVAAAAILYDNRSREECREAGYTCIRTKGNPAKATWELDKDCLTKSRAIFFSDTKTLPASVMLAADMVLDLDPVNAADLQAACRMVLKLKVGVRQARELLKYPIDKLAIALRPNRPASEAIRRLRSMPDEPDDHKPAPIVFKHPRLEELHGYGIAKEWGLQLAADLEEWRQGRLSWSEVHSGLLLSGPPGVGKTIYARALAESCSVNFVPASLAQWQAKGHLGDLLKAMRADFKKAKDDTPSIIFIDEIDSVGDRSTFGSDHASYSIQVVNGLLESIDGSAGREGVVVIGATNHPDKIDPALVRPGRLDRHVKIEMPDEEDRVAILRQLLGSDASPGLDLTVLGPLTEAMAGADLAQLVRTAKGIARRQDREVQMNDLTSQLPKLVPVVGEYRRSIAIHEAGHTIVGVKLAFGVFLGVGISNQINPRFHMQNTGGAGFRRDPFSFRDRQAYRDDICVYLAGIAAEQLKMGSHGDGAGAGPGSDLERATEAAVQMETKFGMGQRLTRTGRGTIWDQHGNQSAPCLMEAVDQILAEELTRAKTMLLEEMTLFDILAAEIEATGFVSPERLNELGHATR
ncbi:AAA family ATPase [Rhizobium sp. LjRoot98]|uniref:AAA family ATPase n=1 Tax=Rhizobium sp. LjRoot98 TaxID=3342345 RepID=UPI003ED01DBE